MKPKLIPFLFIFFTFSCSTLLPQCNKKIGNQAVDGFLQDMDTTYGVCIEVLNPPGTTWETSVVSFDELIPEDYVELEKYMLLFRKEFFKYPSTFIKHTNLKSVVFVKNLRNQNVPVAAMPDYFKENLYMDIFQGNNDTLYQQHVVHHEFYHMIEQEFNGNAYYKDPKWIKMNEPGFKYGNGGINNRTANMRPITHPMNGFISLYAATGLEEDKAELFAALMTVGEEAPVRKWAETDPILNDKINYLTVFLKKYSLILQ